MTSDSVKRRLAAILAADLAGLEALLGLRRPGFDY
jgi:hypothetical protein